MSFPIWPLPAVFSLSILLVGGARSKRHPAIYANRHYLSLYRHNRPERLALQGDDGPTIVGDVYIHSSATVHPTAKVEMDNLSGHIRPFLQIGPNVSVSQGARVDAGVRLKESIVLERAILRAHSCILHSIIGWDNVVGEWARVEGTPIGPNPNMPFAKLENRPLFKSDGRLNPAITILGRSVKTPAETIVLNSIVLPHKELTNSCKNQIIL